MQLFGHTLPPGEEVIVKPTAFTPLPAPTVQTMDPTLPPGQSVVDQKPRAGFDVTVTRFWTMHHRIVRQEIIAQEHRAPRPRLVRVAPPPAPADPLADLLLGGPMPATSPEPDPRPDRPSGRAGLFCPQPLTWPHRLVYT